MSNGSRPSWNQVRPNPSPPPVEYGGQRNPVGGHSTGGSPTSWSGSPPVHPMPAPSQPQWGPPGAPPYGYPMGSTGLPGLPGLLASPWRRLGAVLIDLLILAPLIVVSMVLVSFVALEGGFSEDDTMLMLFAATWLISLPYWGLQAIFVSLRGQTFGKMMTGIRIVRSDGRPCGFVHGVVLRWIPLWLGSSLTGGILGLVNALLVFSERHRTLHDRVADTLVVEVQR